ncbi:hypothetical protein DDB_G0282885 [Dictyostelium discoideum AX4]|uniref:RNA polymerase II-associated protein 3 n=1 Tax=Dictyostelium discoideum TaxID=44689 RepID=Q54RV7_DICDI|nr:hypothetical protein DDB_G0282885 [Dictyostelium discoideum AX4]EAL66022.1 hypothetical protein DDB_G0282885 [Dictyostelium discoideum AX4]|eukprot:XP_639380.1 hypothetical protein DDB_G0282885 [Dictyostelium discoideum AX4]
MPPKSTTNIDNQYLNDYIKDLKKWQIEIKNKDKEIKQSKLYNNNNKNDNSTTDQPQQQQQLTTSPSKPKADNIIDNTNESIKYKEKGNKLFGQQKYKESIEYYTLAIQLDSTNAVLYGNRAMAYLKMKNYQQCEIDSSRCLNLDPTYTKAYHRRGIARVELKHFEEAIQDFKHLLKSDPSNKDILIELNKATSLLKDQKEKEKQKEIDDKLKKEKEEKEEKERKEKEEKSKIIQEIKNVQQPTPITPITPITSTISKSSNLVVEQQPQTQQPQQPKTLTLQERLNRMANLKAPIPKVAPKNSFEFEKVYLSFNNDLSQLYQYFKLIDPNQLPIVLGDALTPSLFSDIISILEKYYLLMSLNIQFSSKNEKSSLKNIINSLNDCNTIDKSKIDYLLNKYAI